MDNLKDRTDSNIFKFRSSYTYVEILFPSLVLSPFIYKDNMYMDNI